MRITESKLRSIIRSVILEDATSAGGNYTKGKQVMGRHNEKINAYEVDEDANSYTYYLESNVDGMSMSDILSYIMISDLIKFKYKGDILKQDDSHCVIQFKKRDDIKPLVALVDINRALRELLLY
jgi:hypothetical protein